MRTGDKIYMANSGERVYMLPQMSNRHGMIAGASGTGKTVTLKVMAESFSALGVPVFLADIKGDLAGMCLPGTDSAGMQKRIKRFGLESEWSYTAFPTCFWDVFGEYGLPVRTTVSEMGPMLLARLMQLSDVQADVLSIVFHIADDKGLLLIDMKDLRAMLRYVGEHRKEFINDYGNMSPQTIGAIQRALLALEDAGGGVFFGEPAVDIADWMRHDADGRGVINVLHSVRLVQNPTLYATFMLFLMSELFESMPEAGDLDKPRIVFFFDEAHLLFADAPKVLLQKIEQVVKLIRSKGVGVYFISQSPSDVPDSVLAQLSNRVQHALRAYTPAEQKAVRVAAQTFRANPAFDTEKAIMELGVGEALVSFLDADGRPGMVERAFILPPQSLMGVIDDTTRRSILYGSPLYDRYGRPIDRDSAFEALERENEKEEKAQQAAQEKAEKEEKRASRSGGSSAKKSSAANKTVSRAANKAASSFGRALGKSIVRGIFGSIKL